MTRVRDDGGKSRRVDSGQSRRVVGTAEPPKPEESQHALLRLQRSVGNRAVNALLSIPLAVQRDDDWTTATPTGGRDRSNAVIGQGRRRPPPNRPAPAIPPVLVSGQINDPNTRVDGLEALSKQNQNLQEQTVLRISNQALGDTAVSAGLLPVVSAMPKGASLSADQKKFVKRVVELTPASEVNLLVVATSVRFDVKVTAAAENGQAWDAPTLKQMYPVLEQLPPSHVEENQKLDELARYAVAGGSSASGSYNGTTLTAKIGVDSAKLGEVNKAADVGDPLRGVNRFNKVVRHEVGHAVDNALKWSKGPGAMEPERGGWKSFDAQAQAVVRQALSDGNSPLAGDDEAIGLAGAQLANHVVDIVAGIKASPKYAAWPEDRKNKLDACQVLPKLPEAYAAKTPWYKNPNGGPVFGNRVFVEAYAGRSWFSYDLSARARKVSQYQFRAPGEWFAEAYATYHEPDPGGPGKLLAPRDASTKLWMDALHATPLVSK